MTAVRSPRLLRRVLRRPLARICIAYLVVIAAIAVVAPMVLPHVATQNAGDLLTARSGPSADHLLGTDTLGRDVLQRLLVGTRVTIEGVCEALLVALVLGVPLGLAAGFLGGWVDRFVGWLADLTFSMPGIIVVIVVLTVVSGSMLAGMVAFGVLAAPGLMRVVRAATLPVREELYVAAARVSGLSTPYIIRRHVLPRIAGPLVVQAALLSATALLIQTGLAFLGLLVSPPAPSWGGMVADGLEVIQLQPWLIWPPGVAIALTILVFGLLGDVVRDASTETWSAVTPRRRRIETSPRKQSSAGGRRSDALLSVQSLTVDLVSEQGSTSVVHDVSFDVSPGETVALVGESGSGKTMTAMAILGLLPDAARLTNGSVVFGNGELTAMRERELCRVRGRQIGYVSQEPMISFDPAFRIGAQIAEMIQTHHKLSRGAAWQRAVDLLRAVRLPDPALIAKRYPHQLSGGMAQRAAIARALAGEPELLIADEPTTALDVTVQAEILDLLRDLQQERGMAVLLITHDWGVVADLCDRAVVMYAGQIVESAAVRAVIQEPLHPYTQALLASNPQAVTPGEPLPMIPGGVPVPGAWPEGCHFHPRCPYATGACVARPIRVQAPSTTRQTRCIHYDRLVA